MMVSVGDMSRAAWRGEEHDAINRSESYELERERSVPARAVAICNHCINRPRP